MLRSLARCMAPKPGKYSGKRGKQISKKKIKERGAIADNRVVFFFFGYVCVCVFVAVWQVCATPRLSSAGEKGRGGDAVLSPTITVETGTFSVKGTMRSTRLVPGISVSLYRRSSTRCFVLATWKGGSCLPCRTHLFISFSSLFFFFLFSLLFSRSSTPRVRRM